MVNDEERKGQLSIGIHSRHIRATNDGTDVSDEAACVDMILSELGRSNGACTIYIMADRKGTIDQMTTEGNQRNCSTVFVQHDSGDSEAIKGEAEHGPFADGGFFRDMVVTKQALSAFIHYKDRSSSALVYELQVYDAMIKDLIDAPMLRCEIDWRNKHKINLYRY